MNDVVRPYKEKAKLEDLNQYVNDDQLVEHRGQTDCTTMVK